MLKVLKIAARNLARFHRRTLLTSALITLGIVSVLSFVSIAGSFKAMMAVPKLWDVAAYEWLDARASLVKKFCAFSAEVPEGFKGVEEIKITERTLEIVEQENGRVVKIALDISRLR